MDRLVRFNVLATSGRAVEAAGDVDTLLLDKTGTITFGNRMATEFIPVPRRSATEDLAEAALAVEPRRRDAGRPLDRGAGQGRLRRRASPTSAAPTPTIVPFAAQTRLSGVDVGGRSIRKGAVDSILRYRRRPRSDNGAGRNSARRSSASRTSRRHAAGRGRQRQAARRHPSQGRRQAGHQGALRRPARHGHPHGDDHRRQSRHRRRHRRRKPASTTSSPRRRRRTSCG